MKNKIGIVFILFWVIITFARVIFHQPWSDEANAWELVRNFQFGSILGSIKYEGHFFVWYLLLLPFAKLNIAYPYSMLLLNWLFCFGAILVLWRFAPFNNYLKFAISFSFPFLTYYPVVARCYSVGIFLLFLLCAMYKDRLKHPIWYASLVLICANTSLMALVGALFFGGILLVDLFKEKQNKDFKITLGIAFVCGILLLIQILNIKYAGRPDDKIHGITIGSIMCLLPYLPAWTNGLIIGIFTFGFGISLFKDKFAMSLLVLTFGFCLGFFQLCYSGDFWHWYFLFIYLICACWLGLDRTILGENMKKFAVIFLCILSTLFIFDLRFEPRVFSSNSKNIANFVKENKDVKFVYMDNILKSTLPYLHDYDYDLEYFKEKNRKKENIELDEIKSYLNFDKENYFIWANCDELSELKNGRGDLIKFSEIKRFSSRYCVYKTELIAK